MDPRSSNLCCLRVNCASIGACKRLCLEGWMTNWRDQCLALAAFGYPSPCQTSRMCQYLDRVPRGTEMVLSREFQISIKLYWKCVSNTWRLGEIEMVDVGISIQLLKNIPEAQRSRFCNLMWNWTNACKQLHLASLFFFFFFKFFPLSLVVFYFFIFWLCWVFGSCEGFLWLRQVGATLHRGARAFHYRGPSRCRAQAPDAQAQ